MDSCKSQTARPLHLSSLTFLHCSVAIDTASFSQCSLKKTFQMVCQEYKVRLLIVFNHTLVSLFTTLPIWAFSALILQGSISAVTEDRAHSFKCDIADGSVSNTLQLLLGTGTLWKSGCFPRCWQMNYWALFSQTVWHYSIQTGGQGRKGRERQVGNVPWGTRP